MFAISEKKQGLASGDSRVRGGQKKASHDGDSPYRAVSRKVGNWAMGEAQTLARNDGTSSIQRQCQCGGSCAACTPRGTDDPHVQARLTVGPVNDPYEREADRVADTIMRMSPDAVEIGTPGAVSSIQRVGESDGAGFDPGPDFKVSQGPGQPLSAATRQFMEPRFGVDFGSVRVHAGAQAAQSAAQIQARAYTHGDHITLGSGASEGDRQLMAHELTHVVQQGGADCPAQRAPLSPRIQRDPPAAANPCPSGVRNIDVFAVNLPGASKSIYDDEAKTNAVLAQCCARMRIVGGESWDTTLMDTDAPNGVLNESASTTVATAEVTAMTAHRPGGDVIHAYYVPSNTLGDRGGSYGYTGMHPTLPPSVSRTNIAAVDTLVHELGHVLLQDGSHHADADNLMASGRIRNVGVDHLDAAQCAKI